MRRSHCPECGASVGLTNTSRFRKHGPRKGLTCSGSGSMDRDIERRYESAIRLATQARGALVDFLTVYVEEITKVPQK